jgi:type I restriction enzyme S subunit
VNPSLVSPRFFFFWLSSPIIQARLRALARKTTNIANLAMSDFAKIEIHLPPLSEQRRIVEILQEAEEIRRLRAEAETKTAELIPAMFHRAYAHSTGKGGRPKLHRLEEIADVQGGIQVTRTRENAPLKVPYLRVANVQRDGLNLEDMKEIGVTEAELERTRLQKGDILVVEGHGNADELGRAAVWMGEIDPCTHQNHLIRVRCKPGYDPAYLLSMLNSALGRRHFLTAGNTTSGLKTISTGIVRNFRMPVPSKESMTKFAELREAVSDLTDPGLRRASLRSKKLIDSLSAHAFSGQLTADWREANADQLPREALERDAALKHAGAVIPFTTTPENINPTAEFRDNSPKEKRNA